MAATDIQFAGVAPASSPYDAKRMSAKTELGCTRPTVQSLSATRSLADRIKSTTLEKHRRHFSGGRCKRSTNVNLEFQNMPANGCFLKTADINLELPCRTANVRL